MKKNIVLFWLLLCSLCISAQVRLVLPFNNNWRFALDSSTQPIYESYSDAHWRNLSLPHDWSIELPFAANALATNLGGSLPGGIGWYRKTFSLSEKFNQKNITIEFDGVYQNSEVWINGHYLGKRPYGYVAFSYDLTPHVRLGKYKNVLVVKVDHSAQPNSRWYTGSGIYRDVQLLVTNKNAVQKNGIFITTSAEANGLTSVNIKTSLSLVNAKESRYSIRHQIFDANKKRIQTLVDQVPYNLNESATHFSSITLPNTKLWSVSNPYQYHLKTALFLNDRMVDEVTTAFGVRSFYFDAAKGFFLNDQYLKLKGVCMHHDLGALGAAFNKAAAKRQLSILKDMGCNAIRFSHNPPAAAMLDLCDEMGFLVIDEAFDMWAKRKNKFDYHLNFKEWYRKDLEAMVLRDRNHPSVIMWSIGNEIREQFDSSGTKITRSLTEIVKALDPTRPVTSALTETFAEKNFITKAGVLDVLGFNYKDYDYSFLPVRFPGQKFIASETASAVETRGVYLLPADSIQMWPSSAAAQKNFKSTEDDYTCSAYDNTFAYWGNTHEKSWAAVKKYDFMAGAFVWSGFDYLGEPTPYPWPARSSYFGIVDLAGFPKDVYYMYQSEWSNQPVLHLLPHWNWKSGDVVDVWAYFNMADEVELLLNGKSLGVKKKEGTSLHVQWKVPFEAGVIQAVSRKNGNIVLTRQIQTAGKPAKIVLMADRQRVQAGGSDMAFVVAKVVDANGVLVPDADEAIQFSIKGSASIAGIDNGYQADTSSFQSHYKKVWKGKVLVMLRSSSKKGNNTLIATAPGLASGQIAIKVY